MLFEMEQYEYGVGRYKEMLRDAERLRPWAGEGRHMSRHAGQHGGPRFSFFVFQYLPVMHHLSGVFRFRRTEYVRVTADYFFADAFNNVADFERIKRVMKQLRYESAASFFGARPR